MICPFECICNVYCYYIKRSQYACGKLSKATTRYIPTIRGPVLAPAHVARHLRHSVGLPDTTGLLVQTVAIPSPAAQAGLQEGDLIVFADGTEVRSIASLHEHLLAARGSTLTLEVLRGTERRVLHIPISDPSND